MHSKSTMSARETRMRMSFHISITIDKLRDDWQSRPGDRSPLNNRQLIAARATFAHVNMERINEPRPRLCKGNRANYYLLIIDSGLSFARYLSCQINIGSFILRALPRLGDRSRIKREQTFHLEITKPASWWQKILWTEKIVPIVRSSLEIFGGQFAHINLT